MNQIALFNQYISKVTPTEVIHYCLLTVKQKKKRTILFLNLHIFRLLHADPELHRTHQKADLVCADGMPLVWLSKFFSQSHLSSRVSGTEIVESILKTGLRVFLVTSTPEQLRLMQKKYCSVVGGVVAPQSKNWFKKYSEKTNIQIAKTNAEVLMIGVSSPKAELWLGKNFNHSTAFVGLAVGSAFEILSDQKLWAPKILRDIGFEWLWRLGQEPGRLGVRYFKDGIFILREVFQALHLLPKRFF